MAKIGMGSVEEDMRKSEGKSIQPALKRGLDFLVSFVLLIVLLPFMALIALAIIIETPGGAIYKQKRIGKNGRPFNIYKFRSMCKDCGEAKYFDYLSELIASERDGSGKALPYRKMNDDGRVTKVGKIIRRFYLDELPQLFNILKGEMSMVGPRPHVQLEVDNYQPEQRRRLSVLPGVTGMWQAEGKLDCTFNKLIALDLYYIDNWSLALDFKIIYKTITVLLKGGEEKWSRMRQKLQPVGTARPVIPVTSDKASMEQAVQTYDETVDVDGSLNLSNAEPAPTGNK